MPTLYDAHQNSALSNISIMYKNEHLIAELLLPRVPVKKKSDFYYKFSKDNLRRDTSVKANKAEANKIDYTLSTGNYQVIDHALEGLITPTDIANADAPLQPFQDMTEVLTDKLLLDLEWDVVRDVLSSANCGTSTTTGLPKYNGSSGDIIAHVVSGSFVVAQNIGKRANTIVMDPLTFVGLQTNTTIINRVKYVGKESISTDILAGLLQVDKVYVADAAYNSAKEGQSDSMSFLAPEGLVLLYVEPNPGLRKASYGYTFTDRTRIVETRKADEIETGAKYVRVWDSWDNKVIDSAAAYGIFNTVQ